MSGRRERINAIFFSVIMVMSMVAMSAVALGGGAAAAAEQPEIEDVSTDAEIHETLDEYEGSDEEVQVVLRLTELRDQDPTEFQAAQQSDTVPQALEAHSDRTQATVLDEVDQMAGVQEVNSFWVTNAILVDVDLSQTSLDELAAMPHVEQLHEDFEVNAEAPPIQEVEDVNPDEAHGDFTWGLEAINAPEAHEIAQGEGAKVGVFDTGVDPTHPDLELPEDNWAEFDADGEPVDTDPQDYGEHGTHVAGTVLGGDESGFQIGVAPEADLYAAPVLGPNTTTFTGYIASFQWAIEQELDAVNMSLGFSVGGTVNVLFIEPTENMFAAGVNVVGSAGNSGDGVTTSPGNLWNGVNSGAAHIGGDPVAFSSSQQVIRTDELFTDLDAGSDPPFFTPEAPEQYPYAFTTPTALAPGVLVASSQPNGAYAPGDYAAISGTSMSAPHKAGTIALLASANEDLSANERKGIIEGTAEHPDDKTDREGAGMIDAHAAVELASEDTFVEGTITNEETGEPIEHARVSAAGGAVDDAGYDDPERDRLQAGEYSVAVAPGETEVTFDWLGYEPTTETVDVTAGEREELDIELTPQTGVELVDGQPAAVSDNSTLTLEVDLGNVDDVTVELSDDSTVDADHVELFPAVAELGLGDAIPIEADQVRQPVVVAVDEGAEGDLVLEHTFTGAGDDVTVETGPTTVDPDAFGGFAEIVDLEVPETAETVGQAASFNDYYAYATIENTGDLTIEEEFEWVTQSGGELSPLLGLPQTPAEDGGNTIELDPGEQFVTTGFRWGGTPPSDGEVRHGVRALNSGTVALGTTQTNAQFELDNLAPERGIVDVGDEVTVTADLTNIGDERASTTAEFLLDGAVLEGEQLTLDPGETEEVEFTVTAPDTVGVFTHAIQADEALVTGQLEVGVGEFDLGDVDESGEVDVVDAAAIQIDALPGEGPVERGIVDSYNPTLADVDRDGDIDITDAGLAQLIALPGGPTAEANITNLDAPTSATVGETITVTATVQNDGPVGIFENAEFRIAPEGEELDGDTVVATQVADIGGVRTDRNVQDLIFEVDTSALDAGSYDHGVFVAGESATAPIELVGDIQSEPAFDVSNINGETFELGEEVEETIPTTPDVNDNEAYDPDAEYTVEVSATAPDGSEINVTDSETFELNQIDFDALGETGGVIEGDDGNFYAEVTISGDDLNEQGADPADVTASLTVADDAELGDYSLTFQVVEFEDNQGVADIGDDETATFDVAASDDVAVRNIEPDEAEPGEEVDVTLEYDLAFENDFEISENFEPEVDTPGFEADVTVDGEAVPTFTNSLEHDGLLVISQEAEGPGTLEISYTVAIPEDASEGEEFDITSGFFEVGDEEINVVGDSTITVAGEADEEPDFQVSDLDAPADADPGEEITVNATVTNEGTASDTQDVLFQLDPDGDFDDPLVSEVAESDLALDPSESEDVSITVEAPNDEGDYEHGIFTDDDSQTATLTVGDDNGEENVPTRTFSSSEASPGDEVDVTLTYDIEGENDFEVIENFEPDVDTPGFEADVTVDGEPVPTFTNSLDDDSLLVISQEEEGPGTLEITYTVAVPDDASDGDEFEISSGGFEVGDDELTVEGNSTITVVENSGSASIVAPLSA